MKLEVDKFKISELVIKKLIPIVGTHPYPLDELLLLASTVSYFKPDLIFEWGTHIGKSARIFQETADYLGLDLMIHSIDLPESVEHVEHPHKKLGMLINNELKNIILHRGDGITIAKEQGLLNKDKRILFFLDGDHEYSSVKKELQTIIEHFPDSPMLVHDTFYQDKESGYNVGPYQAIKGMLWLHSYETIHLKTGLPGMSLLYK